MTYSFEDFKKEFLPLKNEKDIFPDGEIKDYFGDVIYHPKSYSYVSQFVYDKVVWSVVKTKHDTYEIIPNLLFDKYPGLVGYIITKCPYIKAGNYITSSNADNSGNDGQDIGHNSNFTVNDTIDNPAGYPMYPEYGNDNPDHMIAGSLSFIPQQYLCIKDVDYYNTGLQIALECTVIASVGPIYLRWTIIDQIIDGITIRTIDDINRLNGNQINRLIDQWINSIINWYKNKYPKYAFVVSRTDSFYKTNTVACPPPPLPIINPYKVEFIGHTYNFNNKILVYSIFSFSTLYLINNEFKYLNFKLSETHGDTGGVDLNVFFNNDYFAIENRPSANKRYVESLFESPYKLKEDWQHVIDEIETSSGCRVDFLDLFNIFHELIKPTKSNYCIVANQNDFDVLEGDFDYNTKEYLYYGISMPSETIFYSFDENVDKWDSM